MRNKATLCVLLACVLISAAHSFIRVKASGQTYPTCLPFVSPAPTEQNIITPAPGPFYNQCADLITYPQIYYQLTKNVTSMIGWPLRTTDLYQVNATGYGKWIYTNP